MLDLHNHLCGLVDGRDSVSFFPDKSDSNVPILDCTGILGWPNQYRYDWSIWNAHFSWHLLCLRCTRALVCTKWKLGLYNHSCLWVTFHWNFVPFLNSSRQLSNGVAVLLYAALESGTPLGNINLFIWVSKNFMTSPFVSAETFVSAGIRSRGLFVQAISPSRFSLWRHWCRRMTRLMIMLIHFLCRFQFFLNIHPPKTLPILSCSLTVLL